MSKRYESKGRSKGTIATTKRQPFEIKSVELVDMFGDWLKATESTEDYFDRVDLRNWAVREGYRPATWSKTAAGAALQDHRTAPLRDVLPRNTFRRAHFGTATQWILAKPEDAPAIHDQLLREKAKAISEETMCRVIPSTQWNPAIEGMVTATAEMVTEQLKSLRKFASAMLPLLTDSEQDATRSKVEVK